MVSNANVSKTGAGVHQGNPWQYACPPVEWRFLHVLRKYNDIASTLMREAGVPIWDTFTPLLDVYDLSFDTWHYTAPLTDSLRGSLVLSPPVGHVCS